MCLIYEQNQLNFLEFEEQSLPLFWENLTDSLSPLLLNEEIFSIIQHHSFIQQWSKPFSVETQTFYEKKKKSDCLRKYTYVSCFFFT